MNLLADGFATFKLNDALTVLFLIIGEHNVSKSRFFSHHMDKQSMVRSNLFKVTKATPTLYLF
jgi:hypothetical protein